MTNKIQIISYLKANLPTLSVGEPALCTDTKEFFIGGNSGNIGFVNSEELNKIATIANNISVLQALIDLSTDGSTIVIPKGVYDVSQININGKNNIKIYGNGAILRGTNVSADGIFNINNCSNILIEDLTFTYKNKPANFLAGKALCIKAHDYSFIRINNCKFDSFSNVAIWADKAKDDNGVAGGTTSRPIVIENCIFTNQTITADAKGIATSIYLGVDGEYATIVNNQFRKCYGAIRGYGSNALVDSNTIMSCFGEFSTTNALIYFDASSNGDGINSSKVIIQNNRMSHNSDITGIYCIGDKSRNERAYTIVNNHVLVHGRVNSYAIAVKYADGTLIDGNYTSLVGTNKNSAIMLEGTDKGVVGNNRMIGYGIKLNNSNCTESNNVLLSPATGAELFIYLNGSYILNAIYTFRVNWNGILGIETTIPNVTATKESTGVYKVVHNLGHIKYVVNAIPDNTTSPYFVSIVRTANDFKIYTFDKTGVAADIPTMGTITIRS